MESAVTDGANFTVPAAPDTPIDTSGTPVVLAHPRPNPSRAGAEIAFTLPQRTRVRIDVYDPQGRHVRRLFEGVVDAHSWAEFETIVERVAAERAARY